MLEVCIDSMESAINAIHGNADELEVCSSLAEGGLTPSPGLVLEVLKMVSNLGSGLGQTIHSTCELCYCPYIRKKPKVNIMIRCRAGADFCYTAFEMETMLMDIEMYKEFNVDRFVFGALDNNQEVDEQNCSKIIAKAHPKPVTFHRAFDICKNPTMSIECIIDLGFDRLLTSGQKANVDDPEAIKLIRELLERYGEKIVIMPGSGVNANNAKTFIDMGCEIVHSSCKRTVLLPHIENDLGMGTSNSQCFHVTDEQLTINIKRAILDDTYLIQMASGVG